MGYLLVHSPLLGPSSWAGVAAAVAARGHRAVVPDLRAAVTGPAPHHDAIVDAAASAIAIAPVVIVGHSGAGAYLPGIAARMHRAPVAVVFVDAVLPSCTGSHRTDPAVERLLDEHTSEGMLHPWLSWWDDQVVAAILPDEAMRAELAADLPRVPRRLYDEAVPMPPGWCELPTTYLRLSAAYAAEMEEAERRGWPTRSLDADHLTTVTAPGRVLDAVEELVSRLG